MTWPLFIFSTAIVKNYNFSTQTDREPAGA